MTTTLLNGLRIVDLAFGELHPLRPCRGSRLSASTASDNVFHNHVAAGVGFYVNPNRFNPEQSRGPEGRGGLLPGHR
jgi:hypothetical protein